MVSDLGREMFLRNFPPIIFLKGFNFWHILEISYRNFRSFTRTADYPHTVKKKVNRLPALVDNLHIVIQLFGGENVTLR